jgi:Transglutaminase-like superfamily
MTSEKYLAETRLLNFSNKEIQNLIREKGWEGLDEYNKIGAVYSFVQNKIIFGYNESDEIPASKVLNDGYGQCNTKGTLLMALFRAVGIPCRFHGFTIDKALQKGAIKGLAYTLAPKNIIHSWVEINYQNKWINLEGFILDLNYLKSVQQAFPQVENRFCGYGIATSNFQSVGVEWSGKDTYIQKEGINQDFGLYDDPDAFYFEHGSNLNGFKKIIYKHIIRKLMNANVNAIRKRVS